VHFLVGDAEHAPFADDRFDVVLLQSVLHHIEAPPKFIREAFRLAPTVLIHEPNGNNPWLKLIERTSRYHLEHGEKSYSSRSLRRWVQQAGGRIVFERFAGFVPMFCPDWLARLTKAIEPVIETVPVLRSIGCAVYLIVATRNE
jgi:SAM-dependent methyltransferase